MGENGPIQSSLAVAVGAVIGASTRWLVGEVLTSEGFPSATLLLDDGQGATALLYAALSVSGGMAAAACGNLTTFSTFALETVEARDAARIRIVVMTIVGTVAATSFGKWLA